MILKRSLCLQVVEIVTALMFKGEISVFPVCFEKRVLILVVVLSLTEGCMAQSAIEESTKKAMPGARVSIQADARGQAQGLFYIYGERLGTMAREEAEMDSRSQSHLPPPQATALRYMQQQKALLGVSEVATDMKLQSENTDKFGGIHLRYQRHIEGIRLDQMEVLVHLDSKGEVVGINGYITPVTEQLKQYVSMHLVNGETDLDIKKILEIVAADLSLPGESIDLRKAAPLIITEAPYVLWEVEAIVRNSLTRYLYRIVDEPGGTILLKRLIVQS